MKIVVKTLKGIRFEIQVKPDDSVAEVKKNIETVMGAGEYPAAEQTLIHKGKVLKDETTMEANNIAEKSSISIMKRKPASTTGLSTVSVRHYSQAKVAPVSSTQPSITRAIPPSVSTRATATESPPLSELKLLPPGVPTSVSPSYMVENTTSSETERSIQQSLEMCGGNWTRDTVAYALHAAYYNPDRAVEYLYSGILVLIANPSNPNAPGYYLPEVQTQEPAALEAAEPKGFYYFPEGLSNDGSLEFLRHTQQFRVLRLLVRSKPIMLKGILKAIEKRNPPLYKMIRKNRDGFLRLLKDEPIEGEAGGNQMAQPQEQLLDHQADLLASSDDYEEEYLQISPEEYESIQRLEAMGFEHSLVLEVFLACNKNEELAANYLLDHNH